MNGSLVIDVSHINHIDVSEDLTTATIGAGANLGQIYTTLSAYGKTFLGGICPSVALGGYLGAGGYNLQQRQHGLAIDQIVSFKIATASGELLTVSPTQHPELWWAARGGGTFGIIVETTVKILTLPRSAMVKIDFDDKATRFDVTKIYQDWSPKQVPEFTSQLNVYSNRTQLIGWYLGGTEEQLQNIMDESGLLDIHNANVSISGNCSTENSRMFWLSKENSCIPDDEAYENFLQSYNTPAIDLVPIEPAYRIDQTPALPSEPAAKLWPRFGVITKTYFLLKNQPMSDAALQEFVDRSGALDDEVRFWGEFTSFNISAPPTTGSFPWQEEASILGRIEVASPENPEQYAQNRKWMEGFDNFYRAQVGLVLPPSLLPSYILMINVWTTGMRLIWATQMPTSTSTRSLHTTAAVSVDLLKPKSSTIRRIFSEIPFRFLRLFRREFHAS